MAMVMVVMAALEAQSHRFYVAQSAQIYRIRAPHSNKSMHVEALKSTHNTHTIHLPYTLCLSDPRVSFVSQYQPSLTTFFVLSNGPT
jgi:hypothetical protein